MIHSSTHMLCGQVSVATGNGMNDVILVPWFFLLYGDEGRRAVVAPVTLTLPRSVSDCGLQCL